MNYNLLFIHVEWNESSYHCGGENAVVVDISVVAGYELIKMKPASFFIYIKLLISLNSMRTK